MRSTSPPELPGPASSEPAGPDAALPPEFDRRLSPLDAAATEASPAVETRWVPLVPATSSGEWSSRSGAFLMLATRADDPTPDESVVPPPPLPPTPPGLEVRTALVSCLEAILPELEPGWSHCAEHARCRAVQEASAVLWGSAVSSVPAVGPDDGRSPALAGRTPAGPDSPLAPIAAPSGELEGFPRSMPPRLGT